MSDLLLPLELLREVGPEAIVKMALTLPETSWHHGCSIWLSPSGDAMGAQMRDGSSRSASREGIVSRFIAGAARDTKRHPTDILRELLGRPVSIPAQGWRVPVQCDYGRKDVLEAHRFPGVTEWHVYRPDGVGVSPASKGGEVIVHDIAELPV